MPNAPGRRDPRPFFDTSRDLPRDHRVPFEVTVVHRDEDLLVVDKPHFLNTTPRGSHVTESLVVRLRQELDLPDLSPAHRLDRVTAGLVLCTLRPEIRGRYQTLFADRRVRKTYEAVAGHRPELTWPRTVRSRILKEAGTPVAREVPGEPNAETVIELVEVRGQLARYLLYPHTGRTHQLRIQMNSLGLPILGDNFYPRILDTAMDDYRNPLQLLARSMSFVDPISAAERTFHSARRLAAWPSDQE
ncbi:pseudouridine synthase [Nakamurella silvestris]|nr:pseudouridine synthase [Nakamurella silvestris]